MNEDANKLKWPSGKVGAFAPCIPDGDWKLCHVEVANGGSCHAYVPNREWLISELVNATMKGLVFLSIAVQNNAGRIIRVDIRPDQIVMVGEELPGSNTPIAIPNDVVEAFLEGPSQ